jgi:hypothetical protein
LSSDGTCGLLEESTGICLIILERYRECQDMR